MEGVQSSQKFVLVALANYASETGKAYPSVETICRITSQQDATVRRALDALEQAQVIKDTGQRVGNTRQVKVYQLPEAAFESYAKTVVFPKPDENGNQRPPKDPRKTPERPTNSGGRLGTGTGTTEVPPASGGESKAPKRQLTDGWVAAWSVKFGAAYKFNGAADGKAADSLLALNLTPEQILDVAKSAWEKPLLFNCKQATTLRGLASRFNEIRVELKNETNPRHRAGRNGEVDRNAGTLNEPVSYANFGDKL